MNFFIDNWMLLTTAITSGGLLLYPLVKSATAKGLTTNAAVMLINREKGQLIDVSEPEEFALAHAVGAKNIPLGQLDAKLAGQQKNKALPLIFICPTGARAQRGSGMATALGYTQALVLEGGLKSWRADNLPVESSAPPAAAKSADKPTAKPPGKRPEPTEEKIADKVA
ncbi:MAG: rhodanese-like domain-containing protein [Burkholderiaceae bacterium]